MHIASRLELFLNDAEIVSLIELLESALDGELSDNAAQLARLVLSYFESNDYDIIQ